MPIYLTYDNTSLQDGLGAQALRMSGVYSIARTIGVPYIHSPIISAIEDIAHDLSRGNSLHDLISDVNTFFAFPSKISSSVFIEEIYIHTLSLRKLIVIFSKYRFSRKKVLFKILIPMPVLDKFPWMYGFASRTLRKLNHDTLLNHRAPALVAHVRRGYDEKYAEKRYAQNRHLPFSYFTEALPIVCRKFKVPVGSSLVLHTDLVNKKTKWFPSQKGILEGYLKNSGSKEADYI